MTVSRIYEIAGEIITIKLDINVPEVIKLGRAPDDVMDETFAQALEMYMLGLYDEDIELN